MERLGVALTGHWLELDAMTRLARRADRLGYEAVLVDGDVGIGPCRSQAVIHDATLRTWLALAATRHAKIGGIRLPAFWNPALLARSLASLQEASRGRTIALLGAGAGRCAQSIGIATAPAAERVRQLEETADTLRALLGGGPATRKGPQVRIEQAWLRPPGKPLPIVIAAARPRTLAIAARYADVLDANVPPLPEKLDPLRSRLGRSLPIWIWIFTRPGAPLAIALHEYRLRCPWFADLPPQQLAQAILWGEPARCLDHLAKMRAELNVALPLLDLSGLPESAARSALELFSPAQVPNIS